MAFSLDHSSPTTASFIVYSASQTPTFRPELYPASWAQLLHSICFLAYKAPACMESRYRRSTHRYHICIPSLCGRSGFIICISSYMHSTLPFVLPSSPLARNANTPRITTNCTLPAPCPYQQVIEGSGRRQRYWRYVWWGQSQ